MQPAAMLSALLASLLLYILPPMIWAEDTDPAHWLERWRQQHASQGSGERGLADCAGKRCAMPQHLPARQRPSHPQRIPRTLWQHWHTSLLKPKHFALMRRLTEMNPTYEYMLFTDLDCKRMICDLGDLELQQSFAMLRSSQARGHLWRLFALYTFGGVFVDSKVSVLNPFDEYFLPNASVVGGMDARFVLQRHTMAYAPRHPFIRQTLDAVVALIQSEYDRWRMGNLEELFTRPFHSSVTLVLSRNGCTFKPSFNAKFFVVSDSMPCPNISHSESLGYLQLLTGDWMVGRLAVDKEVQKMQAAHFPSSPVQMFLARREQDHCDAGGYKKAPSKPKLLGVVALLLSEDVRRDFGPRNGRNCGFNMSMTFLARNWRSSNPYPVLLMGDQFICVGPDFYLHSDHDKFEDEKDPLSTIAYKRMCAFWFAGFLDVPEIQDYRYVFRLDDDSCITSEIKYDIFKDLQSRGTHYAFRELFSDPDYVVNGLIAFVDEYVKLNGINATHPKLYHHVSRLSQKAFVPSFSTNFEIIDTIRFRAADISDFSNYVLASDMIFHRRWGDAPLRVMQALLFLERDSLLNICDFDYIHSAWPKFDGCASRSSFDILKRLLHFFVFAPLF